MQRLFQKICQEVTLNLETFVKEFSLKRNPLQQKHNQDEGLCAGFALPVPVAQALILFLV